MRDATMSSDPRRMPRHKNRILGGFFITRVFQRPGQLPWTETGVNPEQYQRFPADTSEVTRDCIIIAQPPPQSEGKITRSPACGQQFYEDPRRQVLILLSADEWRYHSPQRKKTTPKQMAVRYIPLVTSHITSVGSFTLKFPETDIFN